MLGDPRAKDPCLVAIIYVWRLGNLEKTRHEKKTKKKKGGEVKKKDTWRVLIGDQEFLYGIELCWGAFFNFCCWNLFVFVSILFLFCFYFLFFFLFVVFFYFLSKCFHFPFFFFFL